ncbi:MAG: dihydroorotase [Patescibacteria group bacterium]|nr:dihydroorotase [Patescibacteria group bacterium]MDD5715544.1 dihydroorotase [Patescibacteria group bacterium]
MDTNLRNCTLTDDRRVDIAIREGKISAIGAIEGKAREINAGGNLVLPGIIDAHVHFREPGAEHKEDWLTGSRAAVAGGVTTVIDMPNNEPPAVDEHSLNIKRGRAQKSLVNYGFFLGATKDNLADIQDARTIAGVKLFMGASTGTLLVSEDEDIKNLLSIPGIRWVVHAEDERLIQENLVRYAANDNPSVHSRIRSRETAIRAVQRIITLAEKTGARVHICHLSTAEEIELVARAKRSHLPITCEVSPHHLFLNSTAYVKFGNFVKVNPPLRTPDDSAALWEALRNGTIDIVATDHAPHTIDEKWKEYQQAPAGIPEIQTSLPLMLNAVYQGKFSLQLLERLMAAQPAALYGIKGKGALAEGFDADITVVDLRQTKTFKKSDVKSKCGWSPYDGWELAGWPIMTFVNGNLVYNNGAIHNEFQGKEISYEKV